MGWGWVGVHNIYFFIYNLGRRGRGYLFRKEMCAFQAYLYVGQVVSPNKGLLEKGKVLELQLGAGRGGVLKEVGSGEGWGTRLKGTKLGAGGVQGRGLGCVNRMSGSLGLVSMEFSQLSIS